MMALLAIICGPLMISGLAMPTVTGETAAPTVIAMGDVSEAQIVEIRDLRGQTILSGEFRSRVDMLGNTEKDAALTDRRGRTVVGEVELEIPAPLRENWRPELEVDIRHHRAAGPRNILYRHRRSKGWHLYDRRPRERGHGTSGRRAGAFRPWNP
jgi:hypothetical protein